MPGELPDFFKWRCLATDPIGMEFLLEVEAVNPASRGAILANYLETVAAVHTAIAEGASKAAGILGRSSEG